MQTVYKSVPTSSETLRRVPFLLGTVLLCFFGCDSTLGQGVAIQWIGSWAIPGDAIDRSKPKPTSDQAAGFHRLGGFSSIQYIGEDQYIVLPDRGPGDDDSIYECRFHTFEIKIDPVATPKVSGRLVRTDFFTTAQGQPLVGDPKQLPTQKGEPDLRFDPEGIRLLGEDQLVVSDEYGPSVYVFSRRGRKLKEFTVPNAFRVDVPNSDPLEEAARNRKGRQPNGGFEGLAVTPSGQRIVALLQKPLIQDSEDIGSGERNGVHCRMIVFDPDGQPVEQFVYTTDQSAFGQSELLAVTEDRFLVIERDSKSGNAAQQKRIYLVDTSNATDVSKIDSLPAGRLHDFKDGTIQSVKKHLVLDLLSPDSGIDRRLVDKKQECLTFGPTLTDGRITLILGVDNDFDVSTPSVFYIYALSPQLLKDLR
jgi:hypothetical protein